MGEYSVHTSIGEYSVHTSITVILSITVMLTNSLKCNIRSVTSLQIILTLPMRLSGLYDTHTSQKTCSYLWPLCVKGNGYATVKVKRNLRFSYVFNRPCMILPREKIKGACVKSRSKISLCHPEQFCHNVEEIIW